MGGRSAEREVSLESGTAVLAALRERGWDAIGVDLGDDPARQLSEAAADRAFLALHGRWGEDGCIQGLLESLRLPYTGSGVLGSALAMDKVVSKRLFDGAGLPTPRWAFPATLATVRALGLPAVLKPRAEGSSVGVVVVRDDAGLLAQLSAPRAAPSAGSTPGPGAANTAAGADAPLLAEAYAPGRELSVAVFGSGDAARVLGTVEIRAAAGHYDYEAKYARDDTEYLVPAPLPEAIDARARALALQAHRLLECSGATRADLRWSGRVEDEPLLLEVNTLPGLTSHSLLPKIAAHAGWSYGELVEAILDDARLKA
ncbi:MAG: D-alanine--D-alanine ligase [Proteobacteria bacterium]|nr:D-alanine--D-alanine ligase [Pseudomonadota bacterium]